MRVCITGGSGFLGRALIARLCADGADRIVTFTRDEQRRAALQVEFGWHPGFRVYAGDVRDAERLPDILHGCEAVVHAAARKVVAGHPDEALENLKTNVIGTDNVIEASRAAGCRKFVLVSSDKAVHAENVYGVSKAMAEHLTINANARTFAGGLRCGVVRYGNVIGSTGSVVVKWRQQLADGRPMTISDPRMTRFWITKGQAVDLVLTALACLRGGEIVVPDLPAAPIWALAAAVAGVDAYGDVEMAPMTDAPIESRTIWKEDAAAGRQYAPRQGGEKLHEELLSDAEVRRAVRVNGRIVVPPFQHAEMWDAAAWLGEPLDPRTVYRSDVWPRQLTPAQLRALLEES